MPTNTYGGDPAADSTDEVRWLIGDTSSPWDVSNEEIDHALAEQGGNAYLAGAMVADALATKYAGQVSRSIGSLSVSYGERAASYAEVASRLRREAGKRGVDVEWYGDSYADKAEVDLEADRIGTAARIGQHDPDIPDDPRRSPVW